MFCEHNFPGMIPFPDNNDKLFYHLSFSSYCLCHVCNIVNLVHMSILKGQLNMKSFFHSTYISYGCYALFFELVTDK